MPSWEVPLGSFLSPYLAVSTWPVLPRASSVWFSMTAGYSTQSTSSWRDGAGAGPGTGSWTSVSLLATRGPRHSEHIGVLPGCLGTHASLSRALSAFLPWVSCCGSWQTRPFPQACPWGPLIQRPAVRDHREGFAEGPALKEFAL